MRKSFLLALIVGFAAMPSMGKTTLRRVEVLRTMQAVADWQVRAFDTPQRQKYEPDLQWTCGALYIGMYDWAALAEEKLKTSRYFDFLHQIGERHHWAVGRRLYHADDICVGQTWLRMAQREKNPAAAAPTLNRAEFVLTHPSKETLYLDYRNGKTLERWSWCDALFMAPPVYLQVFNLTGDERYLRFMKSEFRATCDLLYDPAEHLFYRDARYIGKKEQNGTKVFWGRGNGWVIAGLANMLRIYPKSDREGRDEFRRLFVALAERLAALQQPDGYWHASLLDPASYPSPETSSTGFITYGLAWGINAGLLPKKHYLPVVERGWNALCAAVENDGKLGWVQPVGADPQKVKRSNTAVYGPGALLAAGCEVFKLAK